MFLFICFKFTIRPFIDLKKIPGPTGKRIHFRVAYSLNLKDIEMKHYRIKVRDDKAVFFEELLRYLDFLDYEQVESFSEPRIYTNFELRSQKTKAMEPRSTPTKSKGRSRSLGDEAKSSSAESLREVLARIDQMRDQSRKSK